MSRFADLQIAVQLMQAVEAGTVDKNSPMAIVAKGMELIDKAAAGGNKKELLLKILERVIAGKDGVLGTDDDLLPAKTVQDIQTLLKSNVLESMVETIVDITRGKFDINKAKTTAFSLFEVFKKLQLAEKLTTCFTGCKKAGGSQVAATKP